MAALKHALQALESQYDSLEQNEKTGLAFIVLPMLGVLSFISLYEPPNYISVDTNDLEAGEVKTIIRREEAYLVVKLPAPQKTTEQQAFDGQLLRNPKAYRVFVTESRYGLILLSYKNRLHQSAACQNFAFVATPPPRRQGQTSGFIQCSGNANTTKRSTFVFGLDGRSLSPYAANLHSPVIYTIADELRINL